jgi:hypothetical protein
MIGSTLREIRWKIRRRNQVLGSLYFLDGEALGQTDTMTLSEKIIDKLVISVRIIQTFRTVTIVCLH